MKKNQVKELRDKDVEALKQELEAKLRAGFNLRTQQVTQKLDNPHQLTATRRDVARIKTILRQKQIERQAQRTAAAATATTATATTSGQ